MRTALVLALFGAPALAGIPDGASPDQTLSGVVSGGGFGLGVNGVGDVNGDGYDDIAVGAAASNDYAGLVDLFLGGPSGVSTTADATWHGGASNTQLGRTPVGGDFDADGYSDLVLGAAFASSRRGTADVYPGSTAGPGATPALTLSGTTTSAYASIGMEVGDFDCDGYADLALPEYTRNRIQVYSGSSSGLDSGARVQVSGPGGNSYFGQFTQVGDVNGDGCDDLVTADYGWGSLKGKAWLFLGSSAGISTTASWSLEGSTTSSWLMEVAAGGDLNGDGYGDVAVGSRDASGTVQVFYGSASGLGATADVTLTGMGTAGTIPRIVPDMDGDGYDDLVVGDGASAVRIFRGAAGGVSSTPDATLASPTAGGGFGYFLESAGDVNGDGLPDLVVGAYSAGGGDGRAYVYLAVADADADGVFEPNDCDDADPDVGPPEALFVDEDGDGWGAGGITACPGDAGVAPRDGDCDDVQPDVFPGASEHAGDEVDQDCDGADAQDDDPGDDTGLDSGDPDDTGDPDSGLDDMGDDKGDDPVGCSALGAAPMALGWLVGLVAVARRRR